MFYNATLYNVNFASKWNFAKVASMTGFITNESGYNNSKTALFFINVNKNTTFKNKDIRTSYRSITYLANTTTNAAITNLTTKKQNNISVNPISTSVSSFKILQYTITDLVGIGYQLNMLTT